jgi:hypothetical protein
MDSSDSEQEPAAVNKFVSVKGGEFLDQVSDCLLNKGSVPYN